MYFLRSTSNYLTALAASCTILLSICPIGTSNNLMYELLTIRWVNMKKKTYRICTFELGCSSIYIRYVNLIIILSYLLFELTFTTTLISYIFCLIMHVWIELFTHLIRYVNSIITFLPLLFELGFIRIIDLTFVVWIGPHKNFLTFVVRIVSR